MSLLKVAVNGEVYLVDAPNKSTAKAYGRKQIKVEVTTASASDVTDFVTSGKTIPVLQTAAEAEVEVEVEVEHAE